MKILVAVVALSLVICSDADVDSILSRGPIYCYHGVHKEELVRLEHSFEPADLSAEMRCAFKCVMDAYELTDPVTGEFLPEELRKGMLEPNSKLDKIVETCKETKGENPCDTAFLTALCIANFH